MATKLSKIVADFRTSLATKIAVGGTTATLQSATDDDGVSLPAGQYFFTIDGDSSQKEHIVCTLSGTSLSSIKSITRQGVQSSGAVREHRIGSSVTITNFAHIKYINDLLDGTTNLNASLPLEYDATASITTANQLATKDYVDGVAIAGGADASTTVKGISKLSTAPASATDPIAVGTNDTRIPTQDENNALVGTSGTPSTSNKYVTNDDTATTSTADKVVRANGSGKIDGGWLTVTGVSRELNAGETLTGATLPIPVYQNTSDNEVYASDANDTARLNFFGFAISSSTDGNPVSVQFDGVVEGFTGLSEGENYYVQDTVGTIGVSPGTYQILVGQAISETQLSIIKKEASPEIPSLGTQTDKSLTSQEKTGTFTIPTTGRATLIEFDISIFAILSSGGNSTRIRTYKVYMDLVRQRVSSQSLYTTDTGNQTGPSIFVSGSANLSNILINSSVAMSNSIFSVTASSATTRVDSIVSTENSITFSYTLNTGTPNGSPGGIAISEVIVMN